MLTFSAAIAKLLAYSGCSSLCLLISLVTVRNAIAQRTLEALSSIDTLVGSPEVRILNCTTCLMGARPV